MPKNTREVGLFRFALEHPAHLWERFLEKLDLTPLRSWFYNALIRQENYRSYGWNVGKAYYEFGVAGGGTLTQYAKALRSFCGVYDKRLIDYPIYGFDSFKGLPEKVDARDDEPTWHRGLYAHDLSEVESKLRKLGVYPSCANIDFVEGYFEDTLTPSLRESLRDDPPSIVTIDVDYYSSTKTVLEWLRPTLQNGALFYFDDIWSFMGDPHSGELGAITDFNDVGEGRLTPFPDIGLVGRAYIYSRSRV